ncbi:GNAT family N-acetyltransferase [Enterococcus cecorum]|uniref:GNAT family N-acetyltransferase n=1 Tax=Enterococcus cecorum TaxID=44008 RepID=A0AAW9K050_9ENTE|nr:GNAT family N-acetyltransferase [Enterococcus cecorum]MDZ5545068.1 GNAT family N-acetyltransferase [Enterococcus cecorum]MDZ5549386.1 GNAT family N-acetyltransferase [Enterococcus cecorum]MDZ5552008.1 GNAT family N-acetyltransferase [Enterococcus cecorum]MDZ5565598.1 GNAT family N-acetyltransferase [Enterococcus cecorum]MDZ5566742.1 GNAT family N-acetyltransferase [Enterococcus cecorum]
MSIQILELDQRDTYLQLIVQLWEANVKVTHTFLTKEEIQNIKQYVPQAVAHVPHLCIALSKQGELLGFIGVADQRLEMLFIQVNARGQGIGKQLLRYAIKNFDVKELTVNEQNPQAIGFYEHLGFVTYKRTDLDEGGQPYPLLYMKLAPNHENERHFS